MATHRAFLLLLALNIAAVPLAQDSAEPDPLIPEMLDELTKALRDRRMELDAKAVVIIEELQAKLPDMNDKDRKKVLQQVGRVFVTGRARPPEQVHVYLAAARFLGDAGEDGARDLARAYDNQRIKGREYVGLRAEIILNLGKTGDPRQIDAILKEARRSPDNEVMAAAGEALGFYADAPLKARREIVKELLITYGEVDAKASNPHVVRGGWPQDFTRQNAQETRQAIQARWNRTLSKLTGEDFTKYPDWLRWHNANPRWEYPKDG